MGEFITQIGVGPFISLVAIVGGLLIPFVAIIGGLLYKNRRLTVEATLKQMMIERGMSPEEIVDVLQARMSDKERHEHSRGKSDRCRT
jgi:hypothetical protein